MDGTRRILLRARGRTSIFAFLLLAIATPATSLAADSADLRERDKVCTVCHNESWRTPVLSIYQSKMGVAGDPRTPSCQSCHGASEGHLKQGPGTSPDVVFKKGPFPVSDDKVRTGQCITCHKGMARTHWEGSQHSNNQVACNDCHQSHTAKDRVLVKRTQPEVCFACHREQRADTLKISTHPIRAGKIACSDCHNPHGSSGPSMVKKNTINETCFTCHAEKRGPFLYEHLAVVENCANCHLPHGSNISPLLVSRSPWLCQSCHDGQHSSENPLGRNAAGNQAGFTGTNPSNQATGRGCLNCHSQIHGSNSPAGGYFQR